jgi:hypothetical protein
VPLAASQSTWVLVYPYGRAAHVLDVSVLCSGIPRIMAFVPLMTTKDEASAPWRSGYFCEHDPRLRTDLVYCFDFFSVYRGLKTSLQGLIL